MAVGLHPEERPRQERGEDEQHVDDLDSDLDVAEPLGLLTVMNVSHNHKHPYESSADVIASGNRWAGEHNGRLLLRP